jgi:hypothetical protein
MRETLLLDIPHRQVVFTIPKMLRSLERLSFSGQNHRPLEADWLKGNEGASRQHAQPAELI